MPSSISNSNQGPPAPPKGPWRKIWLCAFLLCAFALAGLELSLRFTGHRPSVEDDRNLWSYWRQKADDRNPKTVVLLGGSRMQVGFSMQAWQKRFPDNKVLQLAVDGSNPTPAFRDLAEDPDFRGIVICDIEAWPILTRNEGGAQADYVSYFHRQWGPSKTVECLVRGVLQHTFVLLNPRFGISEMAKELASGHWPKPGYTQMSWNRSVAADYTQADLQWQSERWLRLTRESVGVAGRSTPEQWQSAVADIARETRQIQDRGGKVIFVRFPTSGALRKMEEKYFPKSAYWDTFARSVGAETIHFEEVPSLRGFNCPEGSHLDERDTPRFTSALADEIVRRGTLSQTGVGSEEQLAHVK